MPTTPVVVQLVAFLAILLALAWPLGIWLAAVADGRLPRWLAPLARLERALYRLAGVDGAESTSWQRYAVATVAFNVVGVVVVYALQRLQGVLPLQPAGDGGGQPRLVVQHRDQLRDQHQLAGLRRRGDDELPDADAGADGAELLLGGDRHRRRLGADPRLRGALGRHGRQLLGRRDARDALRSAADRHRLRALPRRPGIDPEPRCLQGRDDARGDAVDRHGAGRLAGGDQDARHQRRRSFNANSAHPYENPTPLSNFVADAVDLPDPGRAGVRLRPHGRRHAPGLGGARRDDA